MSTSLDEVGRVLAGQAHPYDRVLLLGAMLASRMGAEVIVVGGSAIEVYTRGGYVSGDIDLVAPRELLRKALAEWGFRRDGRLWVRKDWKLAVDIVGEHYTGDLQRTREVVTPVGRVRLAGVEDLIAKRLASAKHWKIPADLSQAALLLAGYGNEIDWTYLDDVAARYEVVDILKDLRIRVDRGRSRAA